jgi:hypothetical protein
MFGQPPYCGSSPLVSWSSGRSCCWSEKLRRQPLRSEERCDQYRQLSWRALVRRRAAPRQVFKLEIDTDSRYHSLLGIHRGANGRAAASPLKENLQRQLPYPRIQRRTNAAEARATYRVARVIEVSPVDKVEKFRAELKL